MQIKLWNKNEGSKPWNYTKNISKFYIFFFISNFQNSNFEYFLHLQNPTLLSLSLISWFSRTVAQNKISMGETFSYLGTEIFFFFFLYPFFARRWMFSFLSLEIRMSLGQMSFPKKGKFCFFVLQYETRTREGEREQREAWHCWTKTQI